MSAHTALQRPLFRIALPTFRFSAQMPTGSPPRKLNRAEVKAMFDRGFRPVDALHMRLTAAERAQLETAARLRRALYGADAAA
ncbi:MAG: hypothetical protein AAF771_15365 [Pseudomonadota bacterium]